MWIAIFAVVVATSIAASFYAGSVYGFEQCRRLVLEYLDDRIAACAAAGIPRDRIVVDPGIGFGKLVPHNLELIAGIGAFHALGWGVMLGVSRKSMIARLSRGEPPDARLPGSLAAALAAVQQGVQILRVHDVAETRRALALWQAVAAG